jgi:hypothetical protein
MWIFKMGYLLLSVLIASLTIGENQVMAFKYEAVGTFDVKTTPADSVGNGVASMAINKTFHGDIDGTSIGQMLAFRSDVEGSAGYVAIERVTATLGGRTGSFTLQHHGIMGGGAQSLVVVTVPDSGTDELTGIAGEMDIIVTPGRHDYKFRYTLPD